MPRAYDNSRREAQARETRERILDAVVLLLREVDPDELSYAEIADQAGLAAKTVYRNFPTLDDLLRAAARRKIDEWNLNDLKERQDPSLFAENLSTIFGSLQKDPASYRLLFAMPMRSEAELSKAIERMFAEQLRHIPKRHRAAVCGLVDLCFSPYVWEMLHQYWGVSTERVTRASLAAVQAMLDTFADDPDLLDPRRPLPPIFRKPKQPR